MGQGVGLAGLVLARGSCFDEFQRFVAMIAVVIEGVVEGIKLFAGDHGEQGVGGDGCVFEHVTALPEEFLGHGDFAVVLLSAVAGPGSRRRSVSRSL